MLSNQVFIDLCRLFVLYGAGLAFFLSVLIIYDRRRLKSGMLLFATCVLLFLIQSRLGFLIGLTEPAFPVWSVLGFLSAVFLIGPTFSRLVKGMMSFALPKARFPLYLHLLPGIITFLWEVWFCFQDQVFQYHWLQVYYFEINYDIYSYTVLLAGGHLLIYFLHIINITWKLKVQFELQYVRYMTAILFLPVAAILAIFPGYFWKIQAMIYFGSACLTLVIFLALLIAFKHPRFFESLQREIKQKRYERTHLHGIDLKEVDRRLQELMEEDELYKDESLRLPQLASQLLINPNQLSRILNENYGKNFNEFINSYRVNEAKRLLVEQPEETVINIAFRVGFNSKSTFNTQFAREVSMSPIEYRKRAGRS